MKIVAVATLSALGLAVAGAQAEPPVPPKSPAPPALATVPPAPPAPPAPPKPPAPPRVLLAPVAEEPETPELRAARERMESAVRAYTEAYRKAHGDRGVWRFTTDDGDANVVILRRGEVLSAEEGERVRALARRHVEARPYRYRLADGVRGDELGAAEARAATEAAREAAKVARREADLLRGLADQIRKDAERLREQCAKGEIPCAVERN